MNRVVMDGTLSFRSQREAARFVLEYVLGGIGRLCVVEVAVGQAARGTRKSAYGHEFERRINGAYDRLQTAKD